MQWLETNAMDSVLKELEPKGRGEPGRGGSKGNAVVEQPSQGNCA